MKTKAQVIKFMRKDKDDFPDRSAAIDIAPHNVDLQADVEKIRDDAKEIERQRMRKWLSDTIASGVSAIRVTLTPVLAELLLERNTNNRKTSRQNEADIRNDIVSKKYKYNGETIKVSKAGVLLDGQHRCKQVVFTGISIDVLIAFDIEDDARYTIDIGKPKSVSNFLEMKGEKYFQVLSSVASYYLQWKQHGQLIHGSKIDRPTKQSILDVAEENKGLKTSIEFTLGATKTIRSHNVVALCHFIFWKKTSREDADHFIRHLIDGDNLRKDDPILKCRARLLNMNNGDRANIRAELIIKGWNAYRTKMPVDKFKLTCLSG